jgi:3-methyladenine DNA glycosylase AlkD
VKDQILNELRQALKGQADAQTQASFQRFFKEGVTAYGVKTPLVTRTARQFFKQVEPLGKERAFALCEELLRSDITEEAFVASEWAYWLRDRYSVEDIVLFERWITSYVNNWAKCDSLCNHAVGSLVERFPRLVEALKGWTASENRWLRRASAVTLIVPAKEGKFLKDIFAIADRLLLDQDDLVQKGYGWLLKEASRLHQTEVLDYILRNKRVMPRTALRYAIEKMPDQLKRQAMARG